MKPLLVVGDTLLDRDLVGRVDRLCPDAPVPVVDAAVTRSRPGGAGLAALLARRDGREVTLITALAPDDAGAELRVLLAAEGIRLIDLGLDGTTLEKVRIRAGGRSLLRLDRGDGGPVGALTGEATAAVRSASAVLVADYGRGVAAAVTELPRVPVVWDPHPRGGSPLPSVTLATPNVAEADSTAGPPPVDGLAGRTAQAVELRRRWGVGGVAITLGSRGALLVEDAAAPPLVVPAPQVPCFDACGAGDRFASAAAGLFADGALPSEAVTGAVAAASAFVGAGGAAAVALFGPAGTAESARLSSAADVLGAVRAAGGTVVATGGCFDLLHAGHISLLQGARSLGDCLIVLLNSDDSVRRLKGSGRPLSSAADRATVLRALDCVDAVIVFDEDTPADALARLRPDVWVKGGDYALAELPEAVVLARYGGQAVVLPYLAGRSTTAIVKEAARHVDPAH